MPKINQEEYEVLKGLDDKWKWIARDKDNTLVMGAGKNERYLDGWFPPENIGDSLVADEINAVKVISEWGNLFQFIKWDDEDPHNIQELIEEYENSPEYVTYISNERTRILSNDLWSKLESEETEVKNIEELKSWFEDDKLYVGEYVKHKINQLDEPEVLSSDWIDEHKENWQGLSITGYSVPEKDLQNLLVPKQELPVIPQFVAEWIEETKPYKTLRVAFEYIAQRKRDNHDDKLAFWVEEGNSETFARAWLDGYEIEQEPKYYAKIKGHENIGSNDKYWNYNTDMEELSIGDSEVHPNVISEYTIKATKDEWANLGINDDNADFVKVEELEE